MEKMLSRLLKAPLSTLVACCLLYSFVGLNLSILARIYSRNAVREVQFRLSVPGLVAELFQNSGAEQPAISEEFAADNDGSEQIAGLKQSVLGGINDHLW